MKMENKRKGGIFKKLSQLLSDRSTLEVRMDGNNCLCDPVQDLSESHSLKTLVNEAGLLPGEGNGSLFHKYTETPDSIP